VTDVPTLVIAGTALGVALVAGWLHLPSHPDLDAERWFKVLLSTLLRGVVEAAGGDVEKWERQVVRWAPYHPAGRYPELKYAGLAPEGFAVPGERALTAALAATPAGPGRWKRLYDDDEAALEARLGDPHDLGPSYDPAALLAPDATWDALAAWAPAVEEALTRRFPAKWVWVRGRAPVDLSAGLDRVTVLAEGATDREIAEALRAAVVDPADRLVVVGEGEAMGPLLRALAATPPVRDRVLVVISVGGDLGDEDWMGRNFAHPVLDTETHRATTYAAVQWLDRAADPPGWGGLPLQKQRFPAPAGEPGVSWMEAVDLGPLPADPEIPVREVARALRAWAALWSLSRQ
jgi:hypothetical protein